MYSIRYQTEEGQLNLKELPGWDEAMACWESLMADRAVRIVPDPRTGLDISLPADWKPESIPSSWVLMGA